MGGLVLFGGVCSEVLCAGEDRLGGVAGGADVEASSGEGGGVKSVE